MSLLRAFSWDLAFYGSSKALVALAWVASVSVLTTKLVPADYAVFWQIFTLITGAATIASTGLVTAMRRYHGELTALGQEADYWAASQRAARRTVLVALVLFLPCYGIAAYLADWGLQPVRIGLSIGGFLAATTFLIYGGQLMATRRTPTYLAVNTGQALLFLALLYLIQAWPVEQALMFLCISYLITAPAYLLSRRKLSVELTPAGALLENDFHRLGLPLALMNVALLLGNLGTQVVISTMSGGQAAGEYAAYAAPVERLVGFTASVAAMAVLPLVSCRWARGERREVMRFLILVVALVTAVALAVSIVLVGFGDTIFGLIIDSKFKAGAALLPLLCAATVASTIAAILADVLVLQKKTLQLAWIFMAAGFVGIVVSAILATSLGAQGAAIGRLVAAILSVLGIAIAVLHSLRQPPPPTETTLG